MPRGLAGSAGVGYSRWTANGLTPLGAGVFFERLDWREAGVVGTGPSVRQLGGAARSAPLGGAAKIFRAFHTVIAVIEVAALGHVWRCALQRRRDNLLQISMIALAIEAIALMIGRGDCPLGPLQRQLGDPKPLFELVLPPRAAKAAVPVLAAITVAGMALVAARPPTPSDTDTR